MRELAPSSRFIEAAQSYRDYAGAASLPPPHADARYYCRRRGASRRPARISFGLAESARSAA